MNEIENFLLSARDAGIETLYIDRNSESGKRVIQWIRDNFALHKGGMTQFGNNKDGSPKFNFAIIYNQLGLSFFNIDELKKKVNPFKTDAKG